MPRAEQSTGPPMEWTNTIIALGEALMDGAKVKAK